MSFIANSLNNIKPSPTIAVATKAAELQAMGKNIISLGMGEPDFDTPQNIKQAAINAINAGKTKYTAVDGTKELKQAICQKLLTENNLTYTLNQISVSTGAKQVIYNALLATLNPLDEVIIPAPYWVSYPDMVLLGGGVPIIINSSAENNFKIIAFKDENKNLKKEVNEPIAFLNNIINSTDSNNKNISLKLFKPDLYKPGRVIDTFNSEPDKFVFVIYKPSNVNIKPKNTNKYYLKYIKGNQDIDTFYLFTSTLKTDSLLKFNTLINKQNNELIIKQKVVKKITKPTFSITKQLELNDTIKINFVNPIIKIDTSRIKLLKDSIKLAYKLLQINNFEIQVIYPKEESTTYKLLLTDSAFLDYYNQYSKQEKVVYVMKNKKEYANLILHVKVPKNIVHPYLLQLLSSDEKIVNYQFTITNNQDINLDNIIPGIYKVKYIYDSNGNGIWDTGDLNTNTQPEKIKYLDQLLTLKAYWDLEQSVLIE